MDNKQMQDLFGEVNLLCQLIVNTREPRHIKDISRIESVAFLIGHHPLILNATRTVDDD